MPGQGHQTSQLPVHGSSPGCGSADNQDGAGRSPGWKHGLFASVAAAGSSDGQELRQEGFDFICQDGVCWKETGGGWAGELRWGHPGGDRGHSARARLREKPWGQELWLLSGMLGPGAQHAARIDAGPKAAALVSAGHGDNVQDGGHPFLCGWWPEEPWAGLCGCQARRCCEGCSWGQEDGSSPGHPPAVRRVVI